ncbi:MAG: TraB/GumN family protein [Steroidobacteraceae bacterium]|nr:TraB/GumN family protein [Nevskiaceae bacterium]MCP5360889.1 TraB/GumN family protein [Nevskiaceae bacterium]MCP5466272.1 TraB/GumN family protein [Nevskiaceae bacterium]MCP5471674.1 TraB/GumN family protein [Nevskiaceae bacterium]
MARTFRRAATAARVCLPLLALFFGGLNFDGARAAAATSAPAATTAIAPVANQGLVWTVRGPAGGTVFLAGSIHLLRADDAALPAALEHAYREAGRLVMEIDLSAVDPAAAAAFTAQHGVYESGEGLRRNLGKRRWQKAQAEFERLGLDLAAFDQLEPWAVALVYSVTSLTQRGFEPTLGVEEQLKARALADGKPIGGLETLEYQLGLFDRLTPADQARLLELTLSETTDQLSDIDALTRAWRAGDETTLTRLLLREYRRFPRLYAPLVHDRNRNWLPQVEALLHELGSTLLVVGALHLVGSQGLVSLLRERGLMVEPFQPH